VRVLYHVGLLSLVVLLALTACNGDKEEVSQDVPTATSAPPTDTPEPTATATEAPPPTEEPQAPTPTEPPAIEAPVVGKMGEGEGRREDIPLMPDATNIVSVGSEVSYDSASPLKTVAEFYETEMPRNGWTADPMLTFVTDFAGSMGFTKSDETATIVLAPSGTGGTRVTIGVQ
jgi:hypothetical protein